MASPGIRSTTIPTAHDELLGCVATIEREIQRVTESMQLGEQSLADERKYLAELQALKTDYENVIMLAFSKSELSPQ